MFLHYLKPMLEAEGVGSAGVEPTSTPSEVGPGGDVQPTEIGTGAVAEYMGIDLSSYPEQERPAIEARLKQLEPKVNEIMREAAPWRTVGKELGMSPEEIRAAIQQQRSGQQIAEALQKLAGNKPPEDELPPDLRDNPIFTDPDYAYVRKAVEHLAEQRIKPLTEAQQRREQEETIRAAQKSCADFAAANPELNLTAEALYDVCIKNRHNPFTQLTQAAIDAAGGLDKFLSAKNKKFLEDYQKQALDNRKKSGTVVAPGAAVGTVITPTDNWDDHYKQIQERFRANRAARMGG